MRTLYLSPPRAERLMDEIAALEVSPLLREIILHIQHLDMLECGNQEHDRLAGLLVDFVLKAPVGNLCLAMPKDSRAASVANWFQRNPAEHSDLKSIVNVDYSYNENDATPGIDTERQAAAQI